MADNPLFFYQSKLREGDRISLPEGTAKHIGQVLRMAQGEAMQLTDGQGMMADCRLSEVGKKRVSAEVLTVEMMAESSPQLRLGIAFTKNASRNEWLLEKATELGVRRITPLITERGNKERIRSERWNAILTSAMLQSKQAWLPVLDMPMSLNTVFENAASQILIAHCMDELAPLPMTERVRLPTPVGEGSSDSFLCARQPIAGALKKGENAVILIGPEGDFSAAEVILAEAAGATEISLGPNRLRTETAALVAITHFYLLNHASSD